jgi:phosphoribosyl 1,2-cyclic phosphodiesterase
MIDCGMPISDIKQKMDYKVNRLAGCLLSHCHHDHSRGAKGLMNAGIDIYCGPETASALNLPSHRMKVFKPMQTFKIGEWVVKALPLVHDVEDFGFLIARDGEKLLFAIDTNYISYRFVGLNYIMIGLNYDTGILRNNVEANEVDIARAKRTLKNHMSLSTCMDFLKANDLSQCRAIYLLHLSNQNSDENMFKSEIARLTGVPVYVAGI